MAARIVGQPLLEQAEAAEDRHQQIVEVMRHSPRQLPDGVELLGFEKLRERRFTFARPLLDPQFELIVESLQFGGTLRDPQLEFGIESLELARLAVQVHEHFDLGAQQLRNHRNRHVVHGAELITAHLVRAGHHDRRDEYDGRRLKARMLADHGRQFEAVQIRHAHVDQNHGDFILEQKFERLARRTRFEKVLADFRQNGLMAEQFGLLVVDQQNVHSFAFSHTGGTSGAATCVMPTTAVRCSPASPDNRTRPPPGTSRGPLSWPWPSTPKSAGGGTWESIESLGWFRSRPSRAS